MVKEGYFKLYRKIQDHWLWPVNRKFTELEAWLDLMNQASFSAHKLPCNGRVLLIGVGEIATSERKLAKRWGWNERTVGKFLKHMEDDGMICLIEWGTKYSRLKLNNYGDLQEKNEKFAAQNTAQNTAESTAHCTADPSWKSSQEERFSTPIIKGKKGNNNNTSPKYSEQDFLTAEFIFSRIRKLNPTHKQPNFSQWANTIRLMREQDKRTDAEIRELFTWANQDSFWATNILSPASLRKQWDRLIIKRNQAPSGHGLNNAYSGDRIIV